MPNSRFALHGKRPSLIHGLCAFSASNSRLKCAFLRLLLTPLSTAPSPPPSQFTVCSSRAFEVQQIARFRLPTGSSHTQHYCGECIRYGQHMHYNGSKTLRRMLTNACFAKDKELRNGTDSPKLPRERQRGLQIFVFLGGGQNIILGDPPSTHNFFRYWAFRGKNLQHDMHSLWERSMFWNPPPSLAFSELLRESLWLLAP